MESKMAVYFVLHVLSCFIFYLCIRRHSRFQIWSECMIVFLIPVFGLLFMAAVKLAGALRRGSRHHDMYLRLKNDRAILGGKLQTAANIIPLSDALFIEDVKEKRGLLTNAIKQNILENGKILRLAMRDSDREVTHYAVAMLTNQLEKTEADLFSLEREIAKQGERFDLLRAYAEKLRTYLEFDFLDRVSQKKKEETYIHLLGKILSQNGNVELYEEYIDRLIRFDRYEQAEKTCAAFLAAYPKNEEPYLGYIKLYTQMKQLPAQQRKIAELKALPIQLSVRALEFIRFWTLREEKRHVQ